jgi:hypothetical protein
VAAVPPAGAREGTYKRFLRVLLPALAVAETLQVYPVAGSQMRIAALIFVPVGALCIADGLASLRPGAPPAAVSRRSGWGSSPASQSRRWGEVRRRRAGPPDRGQRGRLPRPARAALSRRRADAAWRGAGGRIRTAGGAAARQPLHELHRLSNVNSLYLWSGIEPPRPSAPGAWITALDNAEQRPIVARLRASPRPCAIRSEGLAAAWLNGKPRPETPLVDYVFDQFQPVEQFGEFEFLLPR